MSFLTPLYIAGLLAVSLPLLFHFIQRRPRGETPFSSLMFLRSSPPRITSKSRLEHWLLLLLRAAVLCLLALAFARPFWRSKQLVDASAAAPKRIAVLVDISGSMRREDLWQQALAHTRRVLATVTPRDRVALFTFDRNVKTVLGFDQTGKLPASQSVALIQQSLQNVKPGWGATEVVSAAAQVAEELSDTSVTGVGDFLPQLHVISDWQRSAGKGEEVVWPQDVELHVHRVAATKSGNVGLQQMAAPPNAANAGDVYVRITNSPESSQAKFELQWHDQDKPIADPLTTFVPPGSARIVRVPRPTSHPKASDLRLTGDSHSFDNQLFVAPLQKQKMTVRYVGSDKDDDPRGLGFFVKKASFDSQRRQLQFVAHTVESMPENLSADNTNLVVIGAPLGQKQVGHVKRFMKEGGGVVYVIQPPVSQSEQTGTTLAALMDTPRLRIREAESDRYALLGELDFTHPIFAKFTEPEMSDFTKIHFWRHRYLRLPENAKEKQLKVIAKFDNGDAAIVEQSRKSGSLLVFTSGWNPDDSELARATKWVVLFEEIVNRHDRFKRLRLSLEVGQALKVPASVGEFWKIEGRGDSQSEDSQPLFVEPGLFRFVSPEVKIPLAVNIPAGESDTSAMEDSELESYGLSFNRQQSKDIRMQRQRQLHKRELERRQRLWQMFVALAMVCLLAETYVAGRTSKMKTLEEE